MASIMAFLSAHQALIYGALFIISEFLALVPSIESNSIFQMIYNFLKAKK